MSLHEAWMGLCRALGGFTGAVKGGLPDGEETFRWDKLEFFSSYETSYSMTLAYPEDLLFESARAAGIPVEGRDKLAIVKDMVALQRQQDTHHDAR
jgi:hypothetical protein